MTGIWSNLFYHLRSQWISTEWSLIHTVLIHVLSFWLPSSHSSRQLNATLIPRACLFVRICCLMQLWPVCGTFTAPPDRQTVIRVTPMWLPKPFPRYSPHSAGWMSDKTSGTHPCRSRGMAAKVWIKANSSVIRTRLWVTSISPSNDSSNSEVPNQRSAL